MPPPPRQQDARRPSGIVVLGVAHTLDGSGLAKARGHTRREFEQQLRSLLQDNGLRRGSVAVAYVGSQAEQAGSVMRDQGTKQQASSLTLFFNISGVPASRAAALTTALGSPPTLQRLQRFLSTAGLEVTSVRLAATREGGITMPSVAAPAAGTASPPAVLGGNPHPGKTQLKRLPHVGGNGATAAVPVAQSQLGQPQLKPLPHVGGNCATAAVPAAQSQLGQPQLKRLPHVGVNAGGAVAKGQDEAHAGGGCDGFAAALSAAVGGCLSCRGITMPTVAAPAAGTASPPAVLGGNPHPGKTQLKRLPHVGGNGATAAVPAAQSQPGQPQLKRLPHVGVNAGGAAAQGQDEAHAGGGCDGFAAVLFAAVGGCLSCRGQTLHAAAEGKTDLNTTSAAARQPVAVHANGKALANGRMHAAGSLTSSKHGSRTTTTLSDGSSIASSTARTASSGGRRSTTAAAANNGQKLGGKGGNDTQGDAVRPRRRWLCGMGPGGNGLEKRSLPPALRPKRRRTAREQAAAAALLAAGRSVVDAERAHLSVCVPGRPGSKEAGSREAGSRSRSGASPPLRRAGSSGAAASVRRKSSPGETSAPRLATAQRAAAWQERRPLPPPSAPATPSNAADNAADAAAAGGAAGGLQSTPGGDDVSLQGRPPVAEVAAAEARAWAAAVAEASPEDPPPLPPAAATETAGSGHAVDAADAADPDEPAEPAAAALAQAQYLSAADGDAYPADTPMAHASSLSAPAGSSVAYLPLTSTQPDRQPSGTWPRGILKTDGGFADSLKGGFGGSLKGGSGASTPAASLAGSVAGDAADPEHSATAGEVHNEWEPRTPVASPARRSGASVGIKLVPMAVSSNDSTPRTDTLWLPSKDEAPPTPEGIVRRLTQDFEARTQKEGATAGWPLSHPLAQSPLRRSLDGSPVRFGLEHRRTF